MGHESSSCVASIIFFDETDSGVDEKQGDDANKVLPVRGLPL